MGTTYRALDVLRYTDCSFASLGKGEASPSFSVACMTLRQQMPGFGVCFVLTRHPAEDLESCCGLPGKKWLLQDLAIFSGVFCLYL